MVKLQVMDINIHVSFISAVLEESAENQHLYKQWMDVY